MERFSVSTRSADDPVSGSYTIYRRGTAHLSEALPQVRNCKLGASCCTLRFSPEGGQLAGGFFDGGIRIFDVDTVSMAHCLNLPRGMGGTLGQETDGTVMDMEGKVRDAIVNLQWHPGGGRAAVVGTVDTAGTVQLWEVPRHRDPQQPRLLAQTIAGTSLSACSFSSDGSKFVVAGAERTINVFDMVGGIGQIGLSGAGVYGAGASVSGRITGHTLAVVSLRCHPQNPSVFVSSGLDQQVAIWDLRAGADAVFAFRGPHLNSDSMDISRDGNLLLTGSHRSESALELYDIRGVMPTSGDAPDGTAVPPPIPLLTPEGDQPLSSTLCFGASWDAGENKVIAVAGEKENVARIFERTTGGQHQLYDLGTIQGQDHAFWSSAVSADGQTAAFGCSDGAVCLVDVRYKS